MITQSKIFVLHFVAFGREGFGMCFFFSICFFVRVRAIGCMWDLGLRVKTLFVISILILVEFPRRLRTGRRLAPNQYKSLCHFILFVLSYFAVVAYWFHI